MFDKLEIFESKYEELSARLCDPAVAGSSEKYTETMKELKGVEPVALKYREYKKCMEELSQAKELLTSEGDAQLRALAQVKAYRGIEAAFAAEGSQRRQECNNRDPRRCGRRGGCSVCGGVVPYVFHVRRQKGLAQRDSQRK